MQRFEGRRPSLHDVAALAGVSHQTVSRVLNNHPNVRLETRERVLAAIVSLGYRRSLAARALVTSRTRTLGLLVQGKARFGPTSTMLAVARAAREAGYYVSLAVVEKPSVGQTVAALEYFEEQGVEGVVVISPTVDSLKAARSRTTGVPMVIVAAGEQPQDSYRVVSVDQRLGAALATRHLLTLGHPDVVHLAGPRRWMDARERIRGWREERARWGLPSADPIRGDWNAVRGYEAMRELLGRGRPPSAIFAANDQLALGVLRALAEAEVAVPGRVSVVGYDDVEGADYFIPPLTSVRQPFEDLGRRCVEILAWDIGESDDELPPELFSPIEPTLVERATTGVPRKDTMDRKGTPEMLDSK
ncbi:MAG: LacI family DNA-binding transcriptional regulator [Actinomycetota bacterium]